jgi:hypothetical protein
LALAASNRPRSANLDSDPALERVVPRSLCEAADGTLTPPQPRCADDQFKRRRIEIEDSCAGAVHAIPISSVQDFVYRLRVVEADGATSRPEVFFDIRSGATGRGGEARVVRLDDAAPGACPKALTLFRYPSRATLGPVPRGASGHDDWSPSLGNYSRRYRGREIRLTETYVDRNDAFCCPSFKRVSYFRYNRARERYVRYLTRVSRIKN